MCLCVCVCVCVCLCVCVYMYVLCAIHLCHAVSFQIGLLSLAPWRVADAYKVKNTTDMLSSSLGFLSLHHSRLSTLSALTHLHKSHSFIASQRSQLCLQTRTCTRAIIHCFTRLSTLFAPTHLHKSHLHCFSDCYFSVLLFSCCR